MKKLNKYCMISILLLGPFLLASSCQSTGSTGFPKVPPLVASQNCVISAEQQAQALSLDFKAFDQTGGHPASARDLAMKGCHAEAAYMTERYLVEHEGLARREVDVLIWHLGQQKAHLGRYEVASTLFLSTLRPPDASQEADNFDWNAYVLGSWAFLNKETKLLDRSIEALRKKGGQRNLINARALGGLRTCIDKPYSLALGPGPCQPPPVTPLP
jgi:hypothetical protein